MYFDFIGKRRLWFIIALCIIAFGVAFLIFKGLNFGIDFTGGTKLLLNLPGGFSTSQVRDVLAEVEITDSSGRTLTLENSYIQQSIGAEGDEVILRTVPLTEDQREILLDAIAVQWPEFSDADIKNVENVGPVVGGELLRNAMLSLLLASIGMIIYISFRFELKFALAALIPLLFDSFVVITSFSVFSLELNSPFVASVLTIVGYSINNTIVIFDRVRENLRSNNSLKSLSATLNLSINQSMVRTINTSVTTLITVGALLFAGGDTLRDFTLPLFIGIICGTFTSIFLASPIFYELKMRENKGRA
jgi:preprotein translocase subunit SecF